MFNYCRGKDILSNEGHAWVCDGYRSWETATEFTLFTLVIDMGQLEGFEENDSQISRYASSTLFHFVFGFGNSEFNGYYNDGLLALRDSTGSVLANYSSSDRQEILISTD